MRGKHLYLIERTDYTYFGDYLSFDECKESVKVVFETKKRAIADRFMATHEESWTLFKGIWYPHRIYRLVKVR